MLLYLLTSTITASVFSWKHSFKRKLFSFSIAFNLSTSSLHLLCLPCHHDCPLLLPSTTVVASIEYSSSFSLSTFTALLRSTTFQLLPFSALTHTTALITYKVLQFSLVLLSRKRKSQEAWVKRSRATASVFVWQHQPPGTLSSFFSVLPCRVSVGRRGAGAVESAISQSARAAFLLQRLERFPNLHSRTRRLANLQNFWCRLSVCLNSVLLLHALMQMGTT